MTTPTAGGADPFLLLGVARTATDAEIRAAYRSRARDVHPDKRPDDPHAAALFHAIKSASEVLLDPATRAVADARAAAREASEARDVARGATRTLARDALEARERAAAEARTGAAGSLLAADLARLRREGAARQQDLAERAEGARAAAAAAAARSSSGSGSARDELEATGVRVRWGAGYAGGRAVTEPALRDAFVLCGPVSAVLQLRSASAVVVFADAASAEAALVAPPPGLVCSPLGARGGAGDAGGGAGTPSSASAAATPSAAAAAAAEAALAGAKRPRAAAATAPSYPADDRPLEAAAGAPWIGLSLEEEEARVFARIAALASARSSAGTAEVDRVNRVESRCV